MAFDQPYRGGFVAGVHRFALRVYFEDTDFSGVVYHANYLRWLERARSDMLAVAGIDQRAVHEAGEGVYAVARIDMRYLSPARFDDVLLIESRVAATRAASCVVHQTVSRDGLQIARAEVTAAFLSPDGRPRRQPRAWIAAFEQLAAEAAQTEDEPQT